MLYGLIKNMPKAQAMSVTIGGTIGLSYVVWAFYRYTGASLSPSSVVTLPVVCLSDVRD